jgi:long-chain acyl-CoA synthetase
LPQETLVKFEKKFRIPLLEGYGLTEASPVVTLNPLKGRRKPGSIGIALSRNIELKVIDENGKALGAEQVGELLVKGPNVMQGYYHNDEASDEVLKDRWLYTGDMARIDSDGYVYIAGRKKEMINVRGFNVYPREIEEALYQNPVIKEAAVIGVSDEHKGEVPKAFVVLKEGAGISEHQVLQYLRERLAGYKIPKYVEFRPDLPKNTSGKILKRVLKDEEDSKQK